MTLDPIHVRLFESEDGLQRCGLCGAGGTGHNPMTPDPARQFVVIAIPRHEGGPVHPDLIESIDDQGERVVFRHRDPDGRGSQEPPEPPEGHYYGAGGDPDGRVSLGDRIPLGYSSVTTVLERPMVCGDCIALLGGLVGLEDVTPIRAEADELRAEVEKVRAERDRLEVEKAEAEDALAGLQVVERLFGGRAKPNGRSKTTA